MSFEKLLCAIIAVYALLNFVVQPRLTKAWNSSRTLSKVAKAGLLGAVQFARDTAFVATLMFLAFSLLTWCLSFGFGHNASLLEWVVSSASRLHELLEAVKKFWGNWLFLFALALITYVQWRTQQICRAH